MEDVGNVQVGGASHRERRWEAGLNKRSLTMNVCGWGGGSKEGETNNPVNNRRERWGRELDLKVLSISDESLGVERSMSEVGIPPPHNLDKTHAPVQRNCHTIPCQCP